MKKEITNYVYVCPYCKRVLLTNKKDKAPRKKLKTPKGKLSYVFCSKECIGKYKRFYEGGKKSWERWSYSKLLVKLKPNKDHVQQ